MSKIHQGFDIRSASPVDSRFVFDTIAEMRAFDRGLIPPGCITYCKEDLSHYTYITFEGQGPKGWRKLVDDRPTIQVVTEKDFDENLWRTGGRYHRLLGRGTNATSGGRWKYQGESWSNRIKYNYLI